MFGRIIVSVAFAITIFAPSPAPAQARSPDTAGLRWAITGTRGSIADKNDLHSPCEVNAIAIASDGKTIYAIDIPNATSPPMANPGIWKSSDGGISWSTKPMQNLTQACPRPTLPAMDIALAPDNPDLIAIVCLNNAATLRHEIYFSDDCGTTWVYTGAIPWVYGGGVNPGCAA